MLLVWYQSQLGISSKMLEPLMDLTMKCWFIVLAMLFICIMQFTGSFVSGGYDAARYRRIVLHRLFVTFMLGGVLYLFSFIGFAICTVLIAGFFDYEPPDTDGGRH